MHSLAQDLYDAYTYYAFYPISRNYAVLWPTIRIATHYNRYDSVYLTCSKKLTGSKLSPPHGINKK